MPSQVFGRTNQQFPLTWLSPAVPDRSELIDPLVEAMANSTLPIDVSVSPALWGGKLNRKEAVVSCFSSSAYENATESSHAIDLTQAHLIEVLSCLGRETLDFYFLRVRRMVEEFQLAGALEAMELARQEGHIRHLGIACDGPSLSTLGVWQFNDAFEAIYIPDAEAGTTLRGLARERRVGVVWGPRQDEVPEGDARLVRVASAADVEAIGR